MPHINPGDWTPEHEERLRAALNAEADKVRTDPGALGEIRRRTAKPSFWRTPVAIGVACATGVAAALVIGSLTVFAPDDSDLTAGDVPTPTVLESDPDQESAPTGGADDSATSPADDPTAPTPAPSSVPPSPEASSGPAEAEFDGAMPVYYAAPAPSGGLRLTREFHRVQAVDPVTVAVSRMFGEKPADPDYVSLWAPADVMSVSVTDEVIEIDLAQVPMVESPDNDEPAIEAAVQQLVYTATGAAATLNASDGAKPVRVLVNGERPAELHNVGLHMDLTRRSQIEVRQLVQINDPGEHDQVSSPVTVNGEAAAFEAALEWEVRGADGQVVDTGTAQSETGNEFSAFSFSIELEPGTYTLAVSDTDPSSGEGGGPTTDTKEFEVITSPTSTTPSADPTEGPTSTGSPSPTGTEG